MTKTKSITKTKETYAWWRSKSVSKINDNERNDEKDKVNTKDKKDRPVLEKQCNSRSVSTPGKVLQQSAPTNRLLAHLGSYYDG